MHVVRLGIDLMTSFSPLPHQCCPFLHCAAAVPSNKRLPAQPRIGYTVRPVMKKQLENVTDVATAGTGKKQKKVKVYKTKVVSCTKTPAEILEQIKFEFIA